MVSELARLWGLISFLYLQVKMQLGTWDTERLGTEDHLIPCDKGAPWSLYSGSANKQPTRAPLLLKCPLFGGFLTSITLLSNYYRDSHN